MDFHTLKLLLAHGADLTTLLMAAREFYKSYNQLGIDKLKEAIADNNNKEMQDKLEHIIVGLQQNQDGQEVRFEKLLERLDELSKEDAPKLILGVDSQIGTLYEDKKPFYKVSFKFKPFAFNALRRGIKDFQPYRSDKKK